MECRLQDFATYNVDDIAAGLQDFLICVEMFLAALAHAYCFPPRDYVDPTHPRTGWLKSIKIMFDVRDVVDDVQYAVDDTVCSHFPTPFLCTGIAMDSGFESARYLDFGFIEVMWFWLQTPQPGSEAV